MRAKGYGLLAPVAHPLEWTLHEVEARLTHNWGWAIIVTTVVIHGLLLFFKMFAARNVWGCIPAVAPFVVLASFHSVLTGIAQSQGADWLRIADLSRANVLQLAQQVLLAAPKAKGLNR